MRKSGWVCAVILLASGVVSAYAADAQLSRSDKKFLEDAASGGAMEVQVGQLAEERAQSKDVKAFANRMVADHTKAGEELKALAQDKQITVPQKLESKDQSAVDRMSRASAGGNFDKTYMRDMVKDHTKDVAEFQKAAKNVKDPDLKAWADKTLPVLEQHLQQAREVAQKLGVKVAKAER